MTTLTYTTASTPAHFEGILQLQRQNLAINIAPEEAAAQGFVTVVHSLELLDKMNRLAPHMIALDGERVAGYLLAMTAASKNDIPVLVPMFNMLNGLLLHGRPLAQLSYIVVGQVCIARQYRGRGVLDACYAAYKNYYQPQYQLAVTEISVRNTRSARAHERTGFTEVHRYTAPDGEEWSIVVWDWRL